METTDDYKYVKKAMAVVKREMSWSAIVVST